MSRVIRARKTQPDLPTDTEYEPADIETMVREAVASIRQRKGGPVPPVAPVAPVAPVMRSRPIPIPTRQPAPAPRKTRVQVIHEADEPDYYPQSRSQSLPPGRNKVIGTKTEVYNGQAERTAGGLTRAGLISNSKGVIVSKSRSENAKNRFGYK